VKIYLICPVRNCPPEILEDVRWLVKTLEDGGHTVHFPQRDAPQEDATGSAICKTHLEAMRLCDEVHVVWDVDSKGSHFDLGMAYALRKPIKPLRTIRPDTDGKSYWKVMCELG